MDSFQKFIDGLGKIEYAVTVPMFLLMLILMFIQVICRYILKMPLGWSEEILRFIFVAATYMGAAIATKERGHIEINMVEVLITRKTSDLDKQLRAGLIINVIRDSVTSGVLIFLSYEIWKYLVDVYIFHTVSSALFFPMWIVVAFMFAGIVLSAVHSVGLIVLNLNGRGPMGYEFGGEDNQCNS